MISIYKTVEDEMVTLDKIEEGCWVSVIHPNEEALTFLQEETGIDIDDLRAPLDDEERSRIELEDQYNMISVLQEGMTCRRSRCTSGRRASGRPRSPPRADIA